MSGPFHAYTGRDVGWLLDSRAAAHPDKVFVHWEPFDGPSDQVTFAGLADATRVVAAGLADRGVTAGDRVLIHLGNQPEFLVAWFACARLGAIAVTTNTRSAPDELAYFLEHCGARLAITEPAHLGAVTEAAPPGTDIVCAGTVTGTEQRFDALTGREERFAGRPADPAARCSVQYTSGTTARPKGVVWTHANALWAAEAGATHLGLTEDDVVPVYLPLFHSNALALTVLPTLWSGGSIVLQPKFSASRFWPIARRHECTWASVTYFTLEALSAQPDPDSNGFRFWACGAANLASVATRWNIPTVGWYGMTELVSVCLASTRADAAPPGSLGRARPGYEVDIRRDDGTHAATGEGGRLWVRGVPGVTTFLEYLDDAERTASSFDVAGWFDTGDEVFADDAGYFHFRGRAKDMLKISGENVAAAEIESVIGSVEGVAECAVVGRPDTLLSEVAVAFVVPHPGSDGLADRITEACARGLADFKRPREVRFVDELPKGLLGKVRKKDLRDMLTEPGQISHDHAVKEPS